MRIKKVLLDTDVIINILRGAPKTEQKLNSAYGKNIFFISPIVWMEVFKGIRKGEEQKILKLLSFFECMEIGKEIGKTSGDLLKQYSKSHGLEEVDALVAAIAICNNCALFTYNKKHFKMIDIELFD